MTYELTDIINLLERSDRPDRDIDILIHSHLLSFKYTESLDECQELFRDLFPEWGWRSTTGGGYTVVELVEGYGWEHRTVRATHKLPTHAWLIAIIRAMIEAERETDDAPPA